MGRILAVNPRGKRPFSFNDDDSVVGSAAEALKLLNAEQFELLLIGTGKLAIPKDAFIRRSLAKAPLLGVVLIGEPSLSERIAETLVDLVFPDNLDHETASEQVERLLETRRLQHECDLVGKSPELKAIGELIFRVAPTDLPVLIAGESGTGKELIAKAIHRHSKRTNEKFLPVNAAAIPSGTLESELFGHEKGAFTGAISRHAGYFEQANRGTVFLDEVAELPPQVQVKLLRVLETGDLIRVGGTGPVHVDVRLLGATNANLTAATTRGDFREDLYYRLAAVKITIPPLRERPEDIPVLVYKFISEIDERHPGSFGGVSDDAISRMMDYHWPGNVRELRNLVENAVLLAGERPVIPEDLEGYFEEHAGMGRRLPALIREFPQLDKDPVGAALALIFNELKALHNRVDDLVERLSSVAIDDPEKAERMHILKTLRDNDYDKVAAAKSLGISLRTLYRRLKKYRIDY